MIFENVFEEICLMLDFDNKMVSYSAAKSFDVLRIQSNNWYSKVSINFKNQYLFIQNGNYIENQDFNMTTDMRHLSHLQFTDHRSNCLRETVKAFNQTLKRCKFLFAVQVDGKYFSKYNYGNHQVAKVLTRRVVQNLKRYVQKKQNESKIVLPRSKNIFPRTFKILFGKEK